MAKNPAYTTIIHRFVFVFVEWYVLFCFSFHKLCMLLTW